MLVIKSCKRCRYLGQPDCWVETDRLYIDVRHCASSSSKLGVESFWPRNFTIRYFLVFRFSVAQGYLQLLVFSDQSIFIYLQYQFGLRNRRICCVFLTTSHLSALWNSAFEVCILANLPVFSWSRSRPLRRPRRFCGRSEIERGSQGLHLEGQKEKKFRWILHINRFRAFFEVLLAKIHCSIGSIVENSSSNVLRIRAGEVNTGVYKKGGSCSASVLLLVNFTTLRAASRRAQLTRACNVFSFLWAHIYPFIHTAIEVWCTKRKGQKKS